MSNGSLASIPNKHWLSAKTLVENSGFDYAALKSARKGGVLERRVSPKTHRVYYRGKNLELSLLNA